MALLTQYASFFVSPFGEKSVTDELNVFLRSHRIVNVEKKLIDGERGTGWVFIIEYGSEGGNKNASNTSQRIDYREVLNADEYALFDKLRNLRKELADKSGIPVWQLWSGQTNLSCAFLPVQRSKNSEESRKAFFVKLKTTKYHITRVTRCAATDYSM